MTEKKKPCCPHCGSVDLTLIGGVIVSNAGIAYKDDELVASQIKGLLDVGSSLTRELLSCDKCHKQSLLVDAQAVAKLDAKEYLWVTTPWGNKIPVRCPECGNHTKFIRKVVAAVEGLQDRYIEDKKEHLGDMDYDLETPLDEITISYLCDANDSCEGEVVLVPDGVTLSAE